MDGRVRRDYLCEYVGSVHLFNLYTDTKEKTLSTTVSRIYMYIPCV